ncbi:hypothetical protein [Streptomyces sp. bgisy154]|uniref:hypothetical protein n=1 Tax=Streptomyces sp. bgisy154 TaxID=3413794 RepID=UPI003D74E600
MTDSASEAQPVETGRSPAIGYCTHHHGYAGDVRLIDVVEQGSGPGYALRACGPCRAAYNLVPLGDRP